MKVSWSCSNIKMREPNEWIEYYKYLLVHFIIINWSRGKAQQPYLGQHLTKIPSLLMQLYSKKKKKQFLNWKWKWFLQSISKTITLQWLLISFHWTKSFSCNENYEQKFIFIKIIILKILYCANSQRRFLYYCHTI